MKSSFVESPHATGARTRRAVKVLRLMLLALCGAITVSARPAEERALPNEFGVFNLNPFNQRPAQEQVDLAMQAGYDGLMASTTLKDPIKRLREFTAVPAVRDGRFKVYAILWRSQIAGSLDEKFLGELIAVAKSLHAAVWTNVAGKPGERAQTIPRLQAIADLCQAGGVPLVLYPHWGCTFENAEEALEVWEKMQRPAVKLSVHLCHELKAGNRDRLDAVVAKVAPMLALVSLNGVDTTVDFKVKGWDPMILPLDQGDYDVRPFVTALVRHGYRGPILLHNFGFKPKPEEYLPASMRRWREISADVAKQWAVAP